MGFVIFLLVAIAIIVGAVYVSRQGKREIARTGADFERIHEQNKPVDPMADLPPVDPDAEANPGGQTP